MRELDVVNMALVRVGQPLLSQEDYEGVTSPVPEVKLFFRQAVASVLRLYAWSFAMRRVRVLPIEWKGEFKSVLPEGWARVLAAYSGGRPVEDFQVKAGFLWSRQRVDEVELVLFPDEFDLWDPSFTDCVVLRLGAYLAVAICQSRELEYSLLEQLNKMEFPRGVAADSKDSRSRGNSRVLRDLGMSLLIKCRV